MLSEEESICVQKLHAGASREVFNIPTNATFDLLDNKTAFPYISHIDAIILLLCLLRFWSKKAFFIVFKLYFMLYIRTS